MSKAPLHWPTSSTAENIRADVEPYLRPRTPEENFKNLSALCQFGVDVWNSLPHREQLREAPEDRKLWYSQVIARLRKSA